MGCEASSARLPAVTVSSDAVLCRHTADGVVVRPAAWPTDLRAFPDVCLDCHSQTEVTTIFRAATLPVAVNFTDNLGVQHCVEFETADSVLALLVPVPVDIVSRGFAMGKSKQMAFTCSGVEKTMQLDVLSVVAKCTFSYSAPNGVRIDINSSGPSEGFGFSVSPKLAILWNRVHANAKLPRVAAAAKAQQEAAAKHDRDTAVALEEQGKTVALDIDSIENLMTEILTTYVGDWILEANSNPALLADVLSAAECLQKFNTVWATCQRHIEQRSSESWADIFKHALRNTAIAYLGTIAGCHMHIGADRLQAARRARIALTFANLACVESSHREYQAALEYYRAVMLLPVGWPLGDLLSQGVECKGVTQGRHAPGILLMRQVADVGAFQELFDACHKNVYTRDRHGGKVPMRLQIHSAVHCMNDQIFRQYSETRERLKERMNGLRTQRQCREALGLYEDAFVEEFTASQLLTTQHLRTRTVEPAVLNVQSLEIEGCNETFVFHGTSSAASESIVKSDFRLSLAGSSAGTLYGRGLYFAQNPSKSDEYCSPDADGLCTILVCRLLLGRVKYTDEESPDTSRLEVMAKPIPAGGRKNFGFYQSVLGDREKCRGTYKEIIVFDDDLCYPEFIVKYRRVYEASD